MYPCFCQIRLVCVAVGGVSLELWLHWHFWNYCWWLTLDLGDVGLVYTKGQRWLLVFSWGSDRLSGLVVVASAMLFSNGCRGSFGAYLVACVVLDLRWWDSTDVVVGYWCWFEVLVVGGGDQMMLWWWGVELLRCWIWRSVCSWCRACLVFPDI
jgi:hypothetical protein